MVCCVDCMDSSEVLDEYGMTGSQAAQLFWNFSQVRPCIMTFQILVQGNKIVNLL